MLNITTATAEVMSAALKAGSGDWEMAIYKGTVPANAADATSGATKQVTITESGGATGLTLEKDSDGVLRKATGETWKGTSDSGIAGAPTFFRLYKQGENPDSASSSLVRIQGLCGDSPYTADLVFPSNNIPDSTEIPIATFKLTVPIVGCS